MGNIKTVSGMDLVDVLESIKTETRPIEGHTDPGAIEDCWNEVFETLKANDSEGSFGEKLPS